MWEEAPVVQDGSCVLPLGLYTAYTAHLHRDKALLKRLLKVGAGRLERAGNVCLVAEGGMWPVALGLRHTPLLPQGLQKKRPWDAQAALLRRRLLELTQSFLLPLVRLGQGVGDTGLWPQTHCPPPQEQYMASLMPLQKSITPWKVGVWVVVGAGRGGWVLNQILEDGGGHLGVGMGKRWWECRSSQGWVSP